MDFNRLMSRIIGDCLGAIGTMYALPVVIYAKVIQMALLLSWIKSGTVGIMKCRSCNVDNRENARFCRSCGISFDFADFFNPEPQASIAATVARKGSKCNNGARASAW